MHKTGFIRVLALLQIQAALASSGLPSAMAQAAKPQSKPTGKTSAAATTKAPAPTTAASSDKIDTEGFAGLLAIVNKNPNDAAQLDHVRLLSTDKELAERVDLDSIHKYIVSACAATSAFFNGIQRTKATGLSVNCDLLPGNQAIYQLQVRPLDRLDAKTCLDLTHALQKVKVPNVTGQVSLQILLKVWYPKPEAAAFCKKGFELQKADKNKEAAEQYTLALAADPLSMETYTCRGIAYNAIGEYDKAVADLTKSISMGSRDAYINRAYSYRHLKQADLAMADCNKTIELQPNYWEGYISRAELWQDQGKYDEAVKDCDAVLQFMSTCGYAYLIKGEIKLAQKEPDDAIRDLNMAVEILVKSADAYHFRSQAYKLLGRDEEAAADEQRANALGYHVPAT